MKRVQDCTREELDRWVDANASAVRALLPADVVFTNHVLLGGPVGAAAGAPFAVKAHGSELEYSMRGNAELSRWGAEALAAARGDLRRVRAHPRRPRGGLWPRARVVEVPPGVDIDEWVPEPRELALAALLAEARDDPPNPGNAEERLPDEGNADRLAAFLETEQPVVVYFGKLIEQKGVHVLLEAMAGIDARLVVVGFGPERARARELRGRSAGRGAVHGAARAPPPPAPARTRGRVRRAVGLPRGVRDGRGRGRRRRLPAARRPPLRPRRGRGRARGALSGRRAPPGRVRRRRRGRPRAAASPSCSRCRIRTGIASGRPRGRRSSSAGAGPASAAASPALRLRASKGAARFDYASRFMGDEQRVPTDQLLREARERFEDGHGLHGRDRGGVRAPRARVARHGQPLRGGHGRRGRDAGRSAPRGRADRVGDRDQDRARGDVPRRTGDDRRAPRRARRARRAARPRARRHRRAPVGELEGPADHRHAALPAQRRDPPLRRLEEQHLRLPRARRHPGRRPGHPRRERAPQLASRAPGASRRARPSRRASTRDSTRRARRSSPASSRAAACPTRSTRWADYERYVRFLYDTRSIDEHTQLWWSVRPHLAFPTVEIRICDAPARPRRVAVAGGALRRARRRASRGRSTRASRSRSSRTA